MIDNDDLCDDTSSTEGAMDSAAALVAPVRSFAVELSEAYYADQLAQDEKNFLAWWREDTPENRARLEENYVPQHRGPIIKIGYTP